VLLLGCLLLLPNGALWAVAYAAGPGFTVGAGTGVSPFGATLGPVPAFPLLAALPGDGTPPPAVRVVLLVPVLAGVFAGWVVGRRLPAPAGDSRWPALLSGRVVRAAGFGLLAGALTALVAAVLSVLAGGGLGPGYLAAVGPSGWRVLLALAVELAVPAALAAALAPTRTAADSPPAAPVPGAGPLPSGRRADGADGADGADRADRG
jgi:hypothetical protein